MHTWYSSRIGSLCVLAHGGSDKDVRAKILKPIKFLYDYERTTDGSVNFRWPDCFTLESDIEVDEGIDPKRVEFEWVINDVVSAGRLRCMDPAVCGGREW